MSKDLSNPIVEGGGWTKKTETRRWRSYRLARLFLWLAVPSVLDVLYLTRDGLSGIENIGVAGYFLIGFLMVHFSIGLAAAITAVFEKPMEKEVEIRKNVEVSERLSFM